MRRAAWIAIIAAAVLGGALVGRKTANVGAATTRFGVPTTADPNAHVEVDLYKAAQNPKGSLLVFLQGNDPGDPDERAPFAAEVGQAFQQRNMDVAAIGFRVSPEAPLRACATAAARAIAENASHYERVILMGRGVGAWAAAMLALDARLFDEAGFDAKLVKGVIGMRGIYDYATADISAGAFVHEGAPPFLLLSADKDEDRFARIDRGFAQELAKGGVKVERHILPYRDAHSLTHWVGDENDLGELVFGFVDHGLADLAPDAGVIEMQKRWDEKPPLDLAELRASKVETHPVDDKLKATLDILFRKFPYVLHQLPGKTYDAIDLASWLAARPEKDVGKGDYLVVTNMRDERLYYTRADIEKLKPQLVVGLDDEKNLYKLFGYYRLKMDYSWKLDDRKGGPMPLMIRPLGAFLHFPTDVPPELANRANAQFTLTAKSFHWQEQDPLAAVRNTSPDVFKTLAGDQGCLKCHSFRGAGTKAHHLAASDASTTGAFALSFEEYPPAVMKRFLFEQEAVAKGFDVTPLLVPKPIAEELYALVTSSAK